MHTSTVTVAMFEFREPKSYQLKDSDIEVRTTRDTGPGGQHRNTTDSCVVMKHIPTGITAKAADRCQHQNRRTARAMLEARVSELFNKQAISKQAKDRQAKVGSGMRGDKVRTYREQDDQVVNELTGKRASLKKVRAGELGLIW